MPTRRENTRRRRALFREPAQQVLIISGGQATEPAYLNGVRRTLANPSTRSKVVVRAEDPDRVVAFAIRNRSEYDRIWCVLDVDEFDYSDAIRAARSVDIDLAVSNPCFEYWLLLHFEQYDSALVSYKHVRGRLIKHVPSYDKSTLRIEDYLGGIEDAIRRAKARSVVHGDEYRTNPSTAVWRLLELLTGPASE
ncbi:RloB family protein [Nocardia takedensis]